MDLFIFKGVREREKGQRRRGGRENPQADSSLSTEPNARLIVELQPTTLRP